MDTKQNMFQKRISSSALCSMLYLQTTVYFSFQSERSDCKYKKGHNPGLASLKQELFHIPK